VYGPPSCVQSRPRHLALAYPSSHVGVCCDAQSGSPDLSATSSRTLRRQSSSARRTSTGAQLPASITPGFSFAASSPEPLASPLAVSPSSRQTADPLELHPSWALGRRARSVHSTAVLACCTDSCWEGPATVALSRTLFLLPARSLCCSSRLPDGMAAQQSPREKFSWLIIIMSQSHSISTSAAWICCPLPLPQLCTVHLPVAHVLQMVCSSRFVWMTKAHCCIHRAATQR
jgi:hypothetical protein